MADLSQLFGAPQIQRRATVFDYAAPKAQEYKRKLVMGQAMEQDLSPEDGDPFFKFVGERLFQLGDIEGAMAVAQKRQEIMGQQAAVQQQGFENQLKVGEFGLKQEAAKRADRSLDISQQNADVQEFRAIMEKMRLDEGAPSRKLDRLLKQQDLAGGVIQHEISKTQLAKDRVQLQQAMKELEGLGINWKPESEMDKKTVLALNRGALAMRVLGTDLRGYTPSEGVLTFIDQMRASGDNPVSQVWNQLTKKGVYKTLSQDDRRFLMHALSISDLDLRPVSGAALSAQEVAASIMRLTPMPGDDEGVRDEKLKARADVWKGLAGTLPQAASSAFPGVDEAALMSDEELEAIANGRNP